MAVDKTETRTSRSSHSTGGRQTIDINNIVFRWWYILWRNIEQGGETGRNEGRSSKEVREGAMRPSGESGPGCMNSKFKTLLGACLAIPETVGGWSGMRKSRIPRSEVRKAKGQAMQGHLDYVLLLEMRWENIAGFWAEVWHNLTSMVTGSLWALC